VKLGLSPTTWEEIEASVEAPSRESPHETKRKAAAADDEGEDGDDGDEFEGVEDVEPEVEAGVDGLELAALVVLAGLPDLEPPQACNTSEVIAKTAIRAITSMGLRLLIFICSSGGVKLRLRQG
jgi:hypothetical protein